MWRRVAQALRVGLVLLGVVLLAWLPVSWFFSAYVVLPWPWPFTALYSQHSQIGLWVESAANGPPVQAGLEGVLTQGIVENIAALPNRNYVQGQATNLALPIWIPALMALAWPVTSFIIARRRYKRGFPISLAPFAPGEVPGEADKGDRESMSTSTS